MPATTSKSATFDLQAPAVQKFLRDVNSGWKIRLYYLAKLPSLLFWGARVKTATHERCEMTMPSRWSSNNPFKSIYFAAQMGVAEFSTGVLCNIARAGRGKISMLVAHAEATYTKTATGKTTFICEDGEAVIETVNRAIETNKSQKITMTSTGYAENGEVVSIVKLTWSFKCL